jgi:hypothetical protein
VTTAIGAYATAAALKTRINISDSTDDTVLGQVCDQINQYIETKTGRVLAPIASATYLYDGDGTRRLYLPFPEDKAPIGGIRAASLVEVKAYTGAAWETLAAGQYFLRGRITVTGPFEWLVFTDRPTGTYGCWPVGLETVRVTGTAGWTAIPDDITELAQTAATRAWHAVEAGQQDIVGTDDMGRPLVSRFFSARDMETLRKYGTDVPG